MALLNLIRWKNLLILVLAQLLIKHALFTSNYAITSLTTFQFCVLILAALCIAAAGNVINDIYDVEADLINKPQKVIVSKTISEKTANNLFIGLNVTGVLLGFYLSSVLDKTSLFGLFVVISALLYSYASYLKRLLLIGNLIASVLITTSLIVVGIFDLLPAINESNRLLQLEVFKILLIYALFIFILNFLREIAKDIQDVDGDHKVGINTLPIMFGRERTNHVLFILSFIPILFLMILLTNYLYKNTLFVIYTLVFILGPLIITSIKIFNAEKKKDYLIVSDLLILVMVTSLLSMLIPTTFIQ